jgi:hypothetical protein
MHNSLLPYCISHVTYITSTDNRNPAVVTVTLCNPRNDRIVSLSHADQGCHTPCYLYIYRWGTWSLIRVRHLLYMSNTTRKFWKIFRYFFNILCGRNKNCLRKSLCIWSCLWYKISRTERVGVTVMLNICIREIRGGSLGRDTPYLDWVPLVLPDMPIVEW